MFYLALSVAFDDVGERGFQPCVGIGTVHLAGLDQRGDDGPVFGTGVIACEEGFPAVQGDGADRAIEGVAVQFDAAPGQEAAGTFAVFGDAGQRLAQG